MKNTNIITNTLTFEELEDKVTYECSDNESTVDIYDNENKNIAKIYFDEAEGNDGLLVIRDYEDCTIEQLTPQLLRKYCKED